MNERKTALLLATILLLASLLAGCGSGRNVNADTGAFDSWPGGSDLPGGDTGADGQSLEWMLENGAAVQYQRVTCYDAELGCEAVRSVVPADWQTGGQATWTMQSASSLATIDFYAYSPDMAERVGYVSKMTYADPKNGKTYEGGFDDVYLTPVKTFISAEHYAQEFMGGYFGTSMQVLDTRYPEGQDLAALQAYQTSEQRNVDQATAEWLEVNQPLTGVMADVQIRVSGAYVDMRFEQSGVAYKARVCCVIAHATNTVSFPASQYLSASSEVTSYWDTPLFYYYAAEESRFDESAAVVAVFADNLFVNEQWSGALAEAHLQIRQQQWQNWADELAQITQYCQQSAQSYSQSHSQGYSSSSGTLSGNSGSVINGWTNAITGNSYYEGADGAPVLLDDSYYHTYHDGNGGFIQSNDPISGLSEATDLGTMG